MRTLLSLLCLLLALPCIGGSRKKVLGTLAHPVPLPCDEALARKGVELSERRQFYERRLPPALQPFLRLDHDDGFIPRGELAGRWPTKWKWLPEWAYVADIRDASRVHSGEFIAMPGQPLRLITGSEDGCLRSFDPITGKLVSIVYAHDLFEESNIYGPSVDVVAPDHSFFLSGQHISRNPVVFTKGSDLTHFQRLPPALGYPDLNVLEVPHEQYNSDPPDSATRQLSVESLRNKPGHRFLMAPPSLIEASEGAVVPYSQLYGDQRITHAFVTSDSQYLLTGTDMGEFVAWKREGGEGSEMRLVPGRAVHLQIGRTQNLSDLDLMFVMGRMTSAKLSSDGELLVGFRDGRVFTFSANELIERSFDGKDDTIFKTRENLKYFAGRTWMVADVAYSRNETQILAAVSRVQMIKGDLHDPEYVPEWTRLSILDAHDLREIEVRGAHSGGGDVDIHIVSEDIIATHADDPSGEAKFWDLRDKRYQGHFVAERVPGQYRLNRFPIGPLGPNDAGVMRVSPSGRYVAFGTQGGNVVLYNIERGLPIAYFPAFDDVRSFAFSPDEGLLFVGAHKGFARVYDIGTWIRRANEQWRRRQAPSPTLFVFVGEPTSERPQFLNKPRGTFDRKRYSSMLYTRSYQRLP